MVVGVYMKWVIRVIWGSLIALGLGTLLIYPEWFTAEHLADVLARSTACSLLVSGSATRCSPSSCSRWSRRS